MNRDLYREAKERSWLGKKICGRHCRKRSGPETLLEFAEMKNGMAFWEDEGENKGISARE